MRATTMVRPALVALLLAPAGAAHAQQPVQQQPAKQQPAQQQGTMPGTAWDGMPRMQLQRIYAGPLRDTIIQRWRDPIDGTVCYLYLPATAQHSPPTAQGFVQYGPNAIGSISCIAGIDAARSSGEAAGNPAPHQRR